MARKLVAKLSARRWAAAGIILAIAAAVVLGIAARNTYFRWWCGGLRSTGHRRFVRAAEPASKNPTTPPKPTCGGAALDGPEAPPSGAVEVSTAQSLADVVAAHSAGTTYWLSPGHHRLGKGAYNQVIPHAGDTFIGAPGAVLDGGHKNRYAFAGKAPDVTIKFLTVQNFGSRGENNNEGVVNHDSASGWTVSSSTIQKNAGAGVMLGSGSRLIGNCLRDNGQYGFNAYHADGVKDVVLDGNEIAGNNTDDWEKRQPGCGCTGGGKFWETNGARITDNYVHDNKGVGLWADSNNVGFRFEGNYISDNDAEGIMYETSYNALIVNNTFVRNALVKGPTNPGFPASAIYLSESGSDTRVKGPYNEALRVSGNVFVDNWSGVVAWENADRFAGSPANTSTGVGTLVNPIRRHRLRVRDEVEDQEGAVLRRLPMEDAERAGGRQRLRRRPIEDPFLQRLDRLRLQRALLQLRHLSQVVAVQGGGRGEGHHVQAEQRLAEQHLHRGLAFHGEGDWTHRQLGCVAISALRPRRRQQHELIADMRRHRQVYFAFGRHGDYCRASICLGGTSG